MKKQPTLYDQFAWASRDSRNSHLALEAMIKQLEEKQVTLEDCRPFFDMCQRMDQKLLDLEAIIRREHIRTMDVSQHPAPPASPQFELNVSCALRYLKECMEENGQGNRKKN